MALFDTYIAVDWSAAKQRTLGADSIWVAACRCKGSNVHVEAPVNHGTRHEACQDLELQLLAEVEAGRRVLLGFDFAYGYPGGTADAAGFPGDGPRWQRTWQALAERIHDSVENANNRFAVAEGLNATISDQQGPFWGCPAREAGGQLRPTKPAFPFPVADGRLAEYRLTETWLKRAKRSVQSVWKLCYPASVGSQVLMGIPRLQTLRHHPVLAPYSRVWPFETGFTAQPVAPDGPCVLHAEIWPSLAPLATGFTIKDAAQVAGTARWLAEMDAAGTLGALFDVPIGISDTERAICCAEEGWILGASGCQST
jgi:precorrin-8X/cobalt-precorrin-8 methylmutase